MYYTISESLEQIIKVLTNNAKVLSKVDEIRAEAIPEESKLTEKHATIIGVSIPNAKSYDLHGCSDIRTPNGGYRDTQIYNFSILIEVLSSNGRKDTYCREVSTYIQDYITINHEIFHNDWRLFMESSTLKISPSDRSGRWTGQILIECVMYKRV